MASESEQLVEKLKEQRDRFIAFAFAGADLLLEMRDDDTVAYCAGANESLYGLSDKDLVGRALADFIFPRDRTLFDEALQRLRNSGRLDHTPLSLVCTAGTVTRMRMGGIRLPHVKGYHLVLSRVPTHLSAENGDGRVDSKTRFVEMVRQRLNDANRSGSEVMLTLVELSGKDFDKLPPAEAQSLMGTLQHILESLSIDGGSASSLSDRAFGVVHSEDMTPQAIRERLDQLATQFGSTLAGKAVKMRTASLEMEDSTLSDEDIVRALTYVVNAFTRDSGSFAIRSLAEGAMTAIEDTLTRVRNFRSMIKNDRLDFVYQPIVNMRTGAVLYYEAFTRLMHNGTAFTPAQILPFASDTGIISEFDISVCRKVLAQMRNPDEISPLAHIGINISVLSLANPIFFRALMVLLQENRPLLNRLILELTDMTRIANLDEARRLVTRVRNLGVRVALDDFGAQAGAIDVLRALPTDLVKIDPLRIRDAGDPKGMAVLRSMASLCRDIRVTAVGECVENVGMLQMLSDVGIDYAQGYFFGRPAPDGARKQHYYTDLVQKAGTASAAAIAL